MVEFFLTNGIFKYALDQPWGTKRFRLNGLGGCRELEGPI